MSPLLTIRYYLKQLLLILRSTPIRQPCPSCRRVQLVALLSGPLRVPSVDALAPAVRDRWSYSGRYIPFIAKHIIEARDSVDIPLAGLAIGNSIYDPYI